ncbi:heparinase [Pedobacter frigiditerrae]|uniref:Heparinase n=1 Tax=Pedobacter frigiditerrae TaxID=2530452 RepID=A0A4R0MR19_9SPHI|nr:heparinase II/III family protein [Pedobacter frigiditerrae]TCC88722.1 heparinase [Pedobacter frigiditerrae]
MTIRFTTFFCLFLFFLHAVARHPELSAPQCLTKADWGHLPAHPRLFANSAVIERIKKQSDSVSLKLRYILRSDVERKLKESVIVYPEGINNMGTARNVQGRILSLALDYRLTGEARSLQRARAELLALCELKNWGTGHFLDVGEAAFAAGIGFDWLYDHLSSGERVKIASAIKNLAILPALATREGGDSWVRGNFNWNPVCNGGVMVAALAIAELEPELSKTATERAIKNIPYAGATYAFDGAFPEGPSYWAYGTSFYVIAVEALRSTFGKTCGLEQMPGFLKTADYNNQMVGPTGQDYNYSDYHVELQNEPIMAWFAKELKRPDLIRDELTDIDRYHEFLSTGKNAKSGKNVALGRLTPLEIIWWDPSLLKAAATARPPLHWSPRGHLSMGVMRSSWDDPRATYVAIKGGTPNNSHAHMDVGSFILEADGVRWAVDLGTENYGNMRAAKLDLWNYTQNSNRWTAFRAGPESHNILRFNGQYQLIDGKGEVIELPTQNGVVGNRADLSSLYADQASRVDRTVLLNPDRSVTLIDEWQVKGQATEVTFQWLTKASVTRSTDGLLLVQNGESLLLSINPALLNLVTVEIQDVSASTKTQDSPNPGLSRILFKVNTPANASGKLTLRAIPGGVKKLLKN